MPRSCNSRTWSFVIRLNPLNSAATFVLTATCRAILATPHKCAVNSRTISPFLRPSHDVRGDGARTQRILRGERSFEDSLESGNHLSGVPSFGLRRAPPRGAIGSVYHHRRDFGALGNVHGDLGAAA